MPVRKRASYYRLSYSSSWGNRLLLLTCQVDSIIEPKEWNYSSIKFCNLTVLGSCIHLHGLHNHVIAGAQ